MPITAAGQRPDPSRPSWWRAVTDLVFPPACLSCKTALSSSSPPLLCSACEEAVSFVVPPLCPVCGRGFSASINVDHLCSRCLSKPRSFEQARALLYYVGPIKTVLHSFKYNGSSTCLDTFRWLFSAHALLPAGYSSVDMIAPVPLHPRRLRERGFNQALLLARFLFSCAHQKIVPDLLVRHCWTESQTALNGVARRRNLKDCFAVSPGYSVNGKNILLLDDVFTTGTTVEECARTLKKAGATAVVVFTLARVYEE